MIKSVLMVVMMIMTIISNVSAGRSLDLEDNNGKMLAQYFLIEPIIGCGSSCVWFGTPCIGGCRCHRETPAGGHCVKVSL